MKFDCKGYVDTLKKERSIDRIIFVVGMVLMFIGCMIPMVYVNTESGTALKNIFGAAVYFNKAPSAYNATFLVIVWLCSIAGIALFLLTRSIIGDIFVCLLALAFGTASVIGIPMAFSDMFGAYTALYPNGVTPFFGYASVGTYMVVVGILVAVAGTALGAAHIQHPDQVKSN